jgi:RNA polymerase sigma-70 factor, ECF subfamily
MSLVMGASPLASLSDQELMRLVQRSDDRKAFACLYDRHAPQAFRVARSICTRPVRAEEAVQEGFLAIWRGRARYDSCQGSFAAWAMTILRCAAVDAVRYDGADKRPRLTAEQSQPVDAGAPSPEDQAIAGHETDALQGALAELPTAQAEVIRLAFFGELSHSEIAQQLDLPAGTVKGRMRLGLNKLRSDINRDT